MNLISSYCHVWVIAPSFMNRNTFKAPKALKSIEIHQVFQLPQKHWNAHGMLSSVHAQMISVWSVFSSTNWAVANSSNWRTTKEFLFSVLETGNDGFDSWFWHVLTHDWPMIINDSLFDQLIIINPNMTVSD